MFEKLIEKLINKLLGDYVEGVSKQQIQLGVFSGQVKIQNLLIKKDVLKKLNQPFDIKFGMIKKIEASIPWRHLTSQSITASVEGIYLILSPNTVMKTNQDFLEEKIQQIKEQIKKGIENLKSDLEEKEDGYFTGLITKIINNLSIDLKDIHIRIESKNSAQVKNFSFGVCLKEMSFYTTNDDWDREYQSVSEDFDKLNKKGVLKDLLVYLNPNENQYFGSLENIDQEKAMQEYIHQNFEKNQVMLRFSTEARVTQYKITQERIEKEIPQFNVQIELQNSNISVTNDQVQRIQDVLQIVNKYQQAQVKNKPQKSIKDDSSKENMKKWWLYALKYQSQIHNPQEHRILIMSEEKQKSNKKLFKDFYKQNYDNDKGLEQLDEQEQYQMETILRIFKMNQLQKWIRETTAEIFAQKKQDEKKKQGFFKSLFSSKSGINDEEKQYLYSYLSQFVKGDSPESEYPKHYPKFQINFNFSEFKIKLLNNDRGIVICTNNFSQQLFIKQKGVKLNLDIEDFQINYYGKDTQHKILSCKKYEDSKFFEVYYENEIKEDLDFQVDLQLQESLIVYNQEMIQFIQDFIPQSKMDVDTQMKMREYTQQNLVEIQNISNNTIQQFLENEPKFNINVKLSAPNILIPINTQEQKIALHLNLGVLQAIKIQKYEKENFYDDYQINLQNLKVDYIEDYTFDSSNVTFEELEKQNQQYLLDNLDIKVDLAMIKSSFKKININEVPIKVNVSCDKFETQISTEQIKILQKLPQQFQTMQETQTDIEQPKLEKYVTVQENNSIQVCYCQIYKEKIVLYDNQQHKKQFIEIDFSDYQIFFKKRMNQIIAKEKRLFFITPMKGDYEVFIEAIQQSDYYQYYKQKSQDELSVSNDQQSNESLLDALYLSIDFKMIKLSIKHKDEQLQLGLNSLQVKGLLNKEEQSIMVSFEELGLKKLKQNEKAIIFTTNQYERYEKVHQDDFKRTESNLQIKLLKDFMDVDIKLAQIFLEVDTSNIKIILNLLDDLDILKPTEEKIEYQNLNQNLLTPYEQSKHKVNKKEDCQHLMKVNLDLEFASVILKHRKNKQQLACFNINNLNLGFDQYKGYDDIDLNIKNIQILDLCNPQLKSNTILTFENKKNTALQFKMCNKNPLIFNIEDDYQIGDIQIDVYDFQIYTDIEFFMTLGKYVNNEIMNLMNNDVIQNMSNSQINYYQNYISLYKPFWQKIQLKVQNCSVIMKDYKIQNQVQFLIEQAQVEITQYNNVEKKIWQTNNKISLQQMQILMGPQNGTKKNVLDPIDFKLNLKMPNLLEQQKLLMDDFNKRMIELKNQFVDQGETNHLVQDIDLELDDFKFNFDIENIRNLVTIVMNQLNTQDRIFYEQKNIKKVEKKKEKDDTKEKDQILKDCQNLRRLNLNLGEIRILTFSKGTEKNMRKSLICWQNLQVKLLQQGEKKTNIKFTISKFYMYFFIVNERGVNVQQILGKLNSKEFENFDSTDTYLDEQFKERTGKYLEVSFVQDQNDSELNINMDLFLINITFPFIEHYSSIFTKIQLEQKKQPQKQQEQIEQPKIKQVKDIQEQFKNKLKLKFQIGKFSIYIKAVDQDFYFALKGKLDVNYETYKPFEKQKEISEEETYCILYEDQIYLKVSLNDFRLTNSFYLEQEEKFIRKRRVLEKNNLHLEFNQSFKQNKKPNTVILQNVQIQSIYALITNINFNVLYDDVEFVQEFMNNMQKLFSQEDKNSIKYADKEDKKNQKPQQNKQNIYLDKKIYLYFKVKDHIKLTLSQFEYNNINQIFQLKINDLKVLLDQENNLKSIVEFGIFGNYLNFDKQEWEPLIEPCQFIVEYSQTKHQKNVLGQHVSIKNKEGDVFNINLSLGLAKCIKNFIDGSKQNQDNKKITFDNKQMIFINNSGYKISIDYIEQLVDFTNKELDQDKKEQQQLIEIENNEKKMIKQLIDMDEIQRHQFQNYYVNITIHHPTLNIKKIKRLNLRQKMHQKTLLEIPVKGENDYYIVIETKQVYNNFQISFNSPITLINKFEDDVNIEIKGQKIQLEKEVKTYIPFDLIYSNCGLNVKGQIYLFTDPLFSYTTAENPVFFQNQNQNFQIVKKQKNDQTILNIVTAFIFQNFLPQKIFLILSNTDQQEQVAIEPHQKIELQNFYLDKELQFQIQFSKFNLSKKYLIYKNHFKKIYSVELQDEDEHAIEIQCTVFRNKEKEIIVGFYTPQVMVNKTDMQLFYETFKDKNLKHKQRTVGYLDDKTKYQIDFGSEENNFVKVYSGKIEGLIQTAPSHAVQLNGIESGLLKIKSLDKEKNSVAHFMTYRNDIITLENKNQILMKVLEIGTNCVIQNQSKYQLRIIEGLIQNEIIESQDNKEVFTFKVNDKDERHLKFQIYDKETKDTFTSYGSINIDKVGNYNYLCFSKDDKKIIKVNIGIHEDVYIVNFHCDDKSNNISLKNETKKDFIIKQRDQQQLVSKVLNQNEQINIGFTDPQNDTQLSLFIKETETYEVIKVHYSQQGKSIKLGGGTYKIDIQYSEEGVIYCITTKEIISQRQIDNTQYNFMSFNLNIDNLGISIIQKFNKERVESLYLCMKHTKLCYILSQDSQEIQFQVKYINIDNNYSPYSLFPLLLTTKKPEQAIKEPTINFHTILKLNYKEVIKFDLIALEIKVLVLMVEDLLLQVIFSLKDDIEKIFEQKNEPDFDTIIVRKKYKPIELKSEQLFVCKKFQVSNISVIVSFMLNKLIDDNKKKNFKFLDNLKNSIGLSFIKTQDTKFSLKGLVIEHISDTQKNFANQLAHHFKNQALRNVAGVIGNLDIIGSPVSLVSNVGGSLVQFVEKPMKGFVKGPIEGIYGFASGTGNLAKTTAVSAFSSVSKISSSLASGFNALSLDKKYEQEKIQRNRKKPQNVGQGIKKGAYSITKGIKSGITGVFTKPKDEIQDKGAVGIFKGIAKGIGGLVTKPIGGIFDAISQTTQGFQGSLTFADEKYNSEKQRPPRIFYGLTHFIKNYKKEDFFLLQNIQNQNKKYFSNEVLYLSQEIKDDKDQISYYFVLTLHHFFLVKQDMKKVEVAKDMQKIKKINVDQDNTVSVQYMEKKEFYELHFHGDEYEVDEFLLRMNQLLTFQETIVKI